MSAPVPATDKPCLSSATSPCSVFSGDVLTGLDATQFTGGSFTIGASGNDKEPDVEAAYNFVTGGYLNLMSVATGLESTGSDFTFTPGNITNGKSFDWVYGGTETLRALTVKASTGFVLYLLNGDTSGSATTVNLLLNNGGKNPDISHVSFWKSAGGPGPTAIPIPAPILMIGAVAAAFGIARRRRLI